MRLNFATPLQLGAIISRPNRFLMNVVLNGETEVHLAHCPTTGRIGDVNFNQNRIPCLLSEALPNEKRKTKYTVEAISFQTQVPITDITSDHWIGINQTKVNSYLKYFLQNDMFKKMMSGEVKSEVKVGQSRLDFRIGSDYLEIKMPLMWLNSPEHIHKLDSSQSSQPAHFDRLIKHFDELSGSLLVNQRAVIALVYIYDAVPFVRPEPNGRNSKILGAAQRANDLGVETWQINLRIDASGVGVRDYFKLY